MTGSFERVYLITLEQHANGAVSAAIMLVWWQTKDSSVHIFSAPTPSHCHSLTPLTPLTLGKLHPLLKIVDVRSSQ